MKKIIIVGLCFLVSVSSKAQTVGTVTFGANVLSSSINSFDSKAAYAQNLQTRIGYFVSNQVAVGLCLETGINGNNTVPYGLNAFTRWYAGEKTHQVAKFFVEGGVGIANNAVATTANEVSNPDKNWMEATAYVSPGVDVFLGRVVALEVACEYRYIGGADALNRLGVSAGFKVFLSEETFKKMFPNRFVSSF